MDQWKTKVDLRKRDISRQKRSSATEPTIFGENGKVWNKEDQVFFTFVDLEKGREVFLRFGREETWRLRAPLSVKLKGKEEETTLGRAVTGYRDLGEGVIKG